MTILQAIADNKEAIIISDKNTFNKQDFSSKVNDEFNKVLQSASDSRNTYEQRLEKLQENTTRYQENITKYQDNTTQNKDTAQNNINNNINDNKDNQGLSNELKNHANKQADTSTNQQQTHNDTENSDMQNSKTGNQEQELENRSAKDDQANENDNTIIKNTESDNSKLDKKVQVQSRSANTDLNTNELNTRIQLAHAFVSTPRSENQPVRNQPARNSHEQPRHEIVQAKKQYMREEFTQNATVQVANKREIVQNKNEYLKNTFIQDKKELNNKPAAVVAPPVNSGIDTINALHANAANKEQRINKADSQMTSGQNVILNGKNIKSTVNNQQASNYSNRNNYSQQGPNKNLQSAYSQSSIAGATNTFNNVSKTDNNVRKTENFTHQNTRTQTVNTANNAVNNAANPTVTINNKMVHNQSAPTKFAGTNQTELNPPKNIKSAQSHSNNINRSDSIPQTHVQPEIKQQANVRSDNVNPVSTNVTVKNESAKITQSLESGMIRKVEITQNHKQVNIPASHSIGIQQAILDQKDTKVDKPQNQKQESKEVKISQANSQVPDKPAAKTDKVVAHNQASTLQNQNETVKTNNQVQVNPKAPEVPRTPDVVAGFATQNAPVFKHTNVSKQPTSAAPEVKKAEIADNKHKQEVVKNQPKNDDSNNKKEIKVQQEQQVEIKSAENIKPDQIQSVVQDKKADTSPQEKKVSPEKQGFKAEKVDEAKTADIKADVQNYSAESNLNNKENHFSGEQADNKIINQQISNLGEMNQNRTQIQFDRVLDSKDVKQIFNESVLDQVSKKVSAELTNNNSQITISLNPENLGKVDINIVSNNGTLTAQITAENSQVKDALNKGLENLKQSLNDQGINIGKLVVNVQEPNQSSNNNNNNSNLQQDQNFQKFDQARQGSADPNSYSSKHTAYQENTESHISTDNLEFSDEITQNPISGNSPDQVTRERIDYRV